MQVQWKKCAGNVWCSLERVDLNTVEEHGVYIIWHGGNPPSAVRVGQGDVAERLAKHRLDPSITKHGLVGELFVTWASLPAIHRDGVERFLFDKYRPLEGDRAPLAAPIAVNLPQ